MKFIIASYRKAYWPKLYKIRGFTARLESNYRVVHVSYPILYNLRLLVRRWRKWRKRRSAYDTQVFPFYPWQSSSEICNTNTAFSVHIKAHSHCPHWRSSAVKLNVNSVKNRNAVDFKTNRMTQLERYIGCSVYYWTTASSLVFLKCETVFINSQFKSRANVTALNTVLITYDVISDLRRTQPALHG